MAAAAQGRSARCAYTPTLRDAEDTVSPSPESAETLHVLQV